MKKDINKTFVQVDGIVGGNPFTMYVGQQINPAQHQELPIFGIRGCVHAGMPKKSTEAYSVVVTQNGSSTVGKMMVRASTLRSQTFKKMFKEV